MPELVCLGSCHSAMCNRAVAEAGVPHVVVAKSESDEAGTTKMLHFDVIPVMPVNPCKISNYKNVEVLHIPILWYMYGHI